ncbi:DUF3592 domain-containing protein [Mycolicibacterium brumae]|uniref:DUF3592 domain-containing protein n=1 Tax=Mycolicibacterium brumae TaxID=85968 RepID=A0A2G5PGN0_9MYCO|nr:DUF3592 domain-containing protein [Mycolicibacterium brumae]
MRSSIEDMDVPAIVGWIFGVLGALLTIGACVWGAVDIAMIRASDETTGVVVGRHAVTSTDSDGHRSVTYRIDVRYEVDGVPYTHTPSGSSNPAPHVGDKVGVYYRPENPSDARMGGALPWMGHMIVLILGFVFFAVAMLLFFVRRRLGS